MRDSGNFSSQQALIQHVLETKKIATNTKTLNDWFGKFTKEIMSSPPCYRIRNRQPDVPEVHKLFFDYVVTSSMLSSNTTDARIRQAHSKLAMQMAVLALTLSSPLEIVYRIPLSATTISRPTYDVVSLEVLI